MGLSVLTEPSSGISALNFTIIDLYFSVAATNRVDHIIIIHNFEYDSEEKRIELYALNAGIIVQGFFDFLCFIRTLPRS